MFYTYRQNNSFGSFTDPAQTVIVEATSANAANRTAEELGLYFDGEGDCPCCGDRWSAQWRDEDGTEVPTIYGTPISEEMEYPGDWGHAPYLMIVYRDRVEIYQRKEDLKNYGKEEVQRDEASQVDGTDADRATAAD